LGFSFSDPSGGNAATEATEAAFAFCLCSTTVLTAAFADSSALDLGLSFSDPSGGSAADAGRAPLISPGFAALSDEVAEEAEVAEVTGTFEEDEFPETANELAGNDPKPANGTDAFAWDGTAVVCDVIRPGKAKDCPLPAPPFKLFRSKDGFDG